MIKCIETGAGIIFTQHIVRICHYADGCRISTTDGIAVSVWESYENIMLQICNNRLPQEGELSQFIYLKTVIDKLILS